MKTYCATAAILLCGQLAHADCEKLAQRYDLNARFLADFYSDKMSASMRGPPTRMDVERQMLFQAMIAEKCPLPNVNAEEGYQLDAIKCATERMRQPGKPVGSEPACDFKNWKSTQK